ncbi:NAD(+) diphosphatase [Rhodobacteraceae bacterium KMM 6894]|nr:NAD(+) diphosphatase [Rhodobacteraceae bacterium KMM 6894]
MKLAETVTFGGGAWDRAANLRGLADLSHHASQAIVLWRGKVCTQSETLAPLVRVSLDHPALQGAVEPPILLGQDKDGTLVFAQDISHWTPENLDESALGGFVDASLQTHPDLPDGAGFAELRRIMTALTPRDAELAATARAIYAWHDSHRFCAKCGAASLMAQRGWQRNCPACGAHHFPRTDPVVIMLIERGNAVLMGRSPGWPEGMFSLLAGFVEPGETIEAAVRRETLEESNIKVGAVSYLASQPWPFPASLMIGCRGTALSDEITIDPIEIEDARWFTREEILDAFSGQHAFLSPAREGAIAHFLLRNWLADQLD